MGACALKFVSEGTYLLMYTVRSLHHFYKILNFSCTSDAQFLDILTNLELLPTT